MNRTLRFAVAIGAAVATAFVGYGLDASAADGPVLGPGLVRVDLTIKYSKFSFSSLHVRPGTTVQFMVHNDDPIAHELVVGDAAVHLRHEQGSDTVHPPIPGEVSVGPNDVGTTFFRFGNQKRYEFACHLPGHVAYGMTGVIVVDVDRDAVKPV